LHLPVGRAESHGIAFCFGGGFADEGGEGLENEGRNGGQIIVLKLFRLGDPGRVCFFDSDDTFLTGQKW
jgi:hypothetical protein